MTDARMRMEVTAIIAARIAKKNPDIHENTVAALAVMETEFICDQGWLGLARVKMFTAEAQGALLYTNFDEGEAFAREKVAREIREGFIARGWVKNNGAETERTRSPQKG